MMRNLHVEHARCDVDSYRADAIQQYDVLEGNKLLFVNSHVLEEPTCSFQKPASGVNEKRAAGLQ
eukprot:5982636-Pleurochrysis_carterae.AAC.3